MNTPYPKLARRIDVAALDAWNAAIQRSMDEYALCPSAVYAQFNLSAAERMRLLRARGLAKR